MKKNLFTAFIGVSLCALIAFNLTMQHSYANDVSIATIEALAGDDTGGEGGVAACKICGNCTYRPYYVLQQTLCIPSMATHNKCVEDENTCCDTSEQTDCPGILGKK